MSPAQSLLFSRSTSQNSLLQSQSTHLPPSRTTAAIIAGASGIFLVLFAITIGWLVRRYRRRSRIRERRKTRLAQREKLKELDFGTHAPLGTAGKGATPQPRNGKREENLGEAVKMTQGRTGTALSPVDEYDSVDAWEKEIESSGGGMQRGIQRPKEAAFVEKRPARLDERWKWNPPSEPENAGGVKIPVTTTAAAHPGGAGVGFF